MTLRQFRCELRSNGHVTPHTLHHTFVGLADDIGFSELTI
jgi:hypothetical protein